MVKKKLVFFAIILIFFFVTKNLYSDPFIDQWEDSSKNYKQLIEEGFEVKGYDMNTFNTASGLVILFFVTVLQKNKEVYECQEYQTLDENMLTLDLSLVCRKLVEPYKLKEGLGT